MAIAEMSPVELKRRLDAGDDLFVLDVRQPEEFDYCRLPGTTLIPLPDLPARLKELDPTREIVIHCRSGARSLQAAHFLAQIGFTQLHNLTGGILAWSDEVDPTVPKY